ncbi:MAG: glycoside hydrolase family 43 protein [Anaerolineae bacterium]
MNLDTVRMRDPFVLPVPADKLYYLYCNAEQEHKPVGFDVYTSRDLVEWSGPNPVFRAGDDFWADRDFWAPEVHHYAGSYYLFASFKADGICRGTQIMRSAAPGGPFVPISAGPVTPRDWECLDGTLYVDEQAPWIVFCHEWTQVKDGEMCAMPLSTNLTHALKGSLLLFKASQAPWVTPFPWENNWVTDGPCLYRTPAGSLLMVWSSFTETGYSVGIARSGSGTLAGPWQHQAKTLYHQNGGHGSLFRTFEGRLMLAFHQPNSGAVERAHFIPLDETNDTLQLAGDRSA